MISICRLSKRRLRLVIVSLICIIALQMTFRVKISFTISAPDSSKPPPLITNKARSKQSLVSPSSKSRDVPSLNESKIHLEYENLGKQHPTRRSNAIDINSVALASKPKQLWSSKSCSTCRRKHHPVFYSQYDQDQVLWHELYKSGCICNGTYLDIGAYDGVKFSNSKFFHDHLNWRGILIEPLPNESRALKMNRPNDLIYPYAVCLKGQQNVTFKIDDMLSLMQSNIKKKNNKKFKTIPCYPKGLSGIISNAGITAIDVFSLDVEDSELIVLESMNWNIPVGIITVEMHHHVDDRDKEKNEAVRVLLRKHEFKFWRKVKVDEVFVHSDYVSFLRSL